MTATLKTTIIQEPSSATANMTLDTAGNVAVSGMPYGSSSFLRNRIINGNMVIDQRNSGASVAIGSGTYTVDRFYAIMQAGSGNTAQRSTAVPAGFINSTVITVGTGAAPTSTQAGLFYQAIEGLNVADLNWGSSSALTVTLSFWVRSSLTGTFGCGIKNGAGTRSYTASYTISSANTWQQVSVTIPGDTTGAWATDNSIGFLVGFDIGEGSTRSQAAGSWTSGNTIGLTGGTKLCATSGATFYITGVQLEPGSVATPFERPLYSKQLADCQRYYRKTTGSTNTEPTLYAYGTSAQVVGSSWVFPVPMRTAPTATTTGTLSFGNASTPVITAEANSYALYVTCTSGTAITVSFNPNNSYQIGFSAEL